MRLLRPLLWLVPMAAIGLGLSILLSGCSGSSSPSVSQVDASKKEQQLLHDQMQKGFAKCPGSATEISRSAHGAESEAMAMAACARRNVLLIHEGPQ